MMSKTLSKRGRQEFPIKHVYNRKTLTEAMQKLFWLVWYKKTFISAIFHVLKKKPLKNKTSEEIDLHVCSKLIIIFKFFNKENKASQVKFVFGFFLKCISMVHFNAHFEQKICLWWGFKIVAVYEHWKTVGSINILLFEN